MADSVVKLRVDSKEYEAKIKRAADGLRAFGENCKKAGQSVDKAEKDTLDYVRAIGRMETVSKTAKGKVNEMASAFTELSVQYRQLTDQEKQSPFGKALTQSLDQLKGRIRDTKNELAAINSELGQKHEVSVPDAGGFLGGGKLDGMLAVFGGNLMTKAVGFATGLVSQMGDAIQQGIELAKAGEGVRIAFERLNRPDLLDKLREATHGTVTDLELMKQAVKFNDFNLSLDEMGTMLAFAQQKAKDTGQSVDYMVDSIVTGLGRKSLMILDNLGLSASEIKDKMAETGDMTKAVGAIIRDQMSKAGDYVETTADRAARADAELKNAMEELGRTFQPLAETGAAMFQSLEIGAIRLLTRAIQPLIDKFTTLGRLRKEYENAGGTTRVGTDIERLRNNSSNSAYRVMLAQYDREIQNRQRAMDAWHAWRSGDRSAKAESEMQWAKSNYGTDTGDITAQMNAWKKMRGEFVEQSKAIMNPVKVTVDTKDAIVGVDSLKIKLQELEAQRRNAIKAGDHDQVKNLTQQINQVKADIKGLDPTALKTPRVGSGSTKTPKTEQQLNTEQIQKLNQEYINATDARKAAIRDEIKVLQDRNTEIQRLIDESNGKDIYPTGSLKDYQKQVADLTKAQQEATSGREWDEYARKIDDVNRKMSILKGNLPKDSEATLTMNVDAKDVDNLREKYHNAVFTPIVKPKVEEQKAENMPPLLPSPRQEAKPIWTMPAFDPLADAVKEPEQVAVTVTADTDEALKSLRDLMDQYEDAQITIKVKEQMETGFSGMTQDSLSAWKRAQEKSLATKQIGSEDYMATYANIIDTTTLSNLVSTAIKNGVKIDSNAIEGLWDQIIGGGNIPDDAWQSLVDTINTRMKELGLEPIKLNVDTGNVTQAGKQVGDSWRAAASAVQAVGGALQQIEDPGAKIAGLIGQAVANIALGFAQATAAASGSGIFGWIAAIAGGLGTMISTISAIHSATGYAEGGIIKGNSYSGDNIMANGGTIGLNAGELVLNRAQQGSIAAQLSDVRGGGERQPYLDVETIWLGISNHLKRRGMGEIVTTKG